MGLNGVTFWTAVPKYKLLGVVKVGVEGSLKFFLAAIASESP
jgi:hypothetical protein